jgi:hypothetical protein
MKSKNLFSKKLEGFLIKHSLILTTFILLLFAAIYCNGQSNETKEEFWDELTMCLGDNARGNYDAECIAEDTYFPFSYIINDEEKSYSKKEFIKNFEGLFDIAGPSIIGLKYDEKIQFKIFKATTDHKRMGVNPGSEILQVTALKSDIEYSDNLKYDKYSFLIGEVKGKNQLIGLIVEDDFVNFWSEFKAAVVAKDANKVSEMTYFPLIALEEVGSGNEMYFDISKNDFLKYQYQNYFSDKKTISTFSSTKYEKLKTIELNGKEFFTDDDGGEVGKDLIDGMKMRELKIGNSKEWSIYRFSLINGKYLLVMLEYHKPEEN